MEKKSRDESLIKTIISLAKSEDSINKIPNLQHVAVEGIEIYNEGTYVEFPPPPMRSALFVQGFTGKTS